MTVLLVSILDPLLSGRDPCLETLRAQREHARVTRQAWDDAGFLAELDVPDAAPHLGRTIACTVEADGRLGGQDGVFVLVMRDGAMRRLEFAAWAGAVSPNGTLERLDAPGCVCRHGGM